MKPEQPVQSVLDRPTTAADEAPPDLAGAIGGPMLRVSFVPTPTGVYRAHRKALWATVEPGVPRPLPIPIPVPVATGVRVLLWKQDPSVSEIGIRKAFLPNPVVAGPRDGRITTQGLPIVSPNALGDFIQTPGTAA